MKGTVCEIQFAGRGAKYSIIGDDGKTYIYQCTSFSDSSEHLKKKDRVEFDFIERTDKPIGQAYSVKRIDESTIKPESLMSGIHNENERDLPSETDSTGHKYYTPGYSLHLNKETIFKRLKPESGEDYVLEKLSSILRIQYVDRHDIGAGETYPFCVIGATNFIKQYVGGYEFLLIFSHFNSKAWRKNTLKAYDNIRKRGEIRERRPVVNFYILISNAIDFKKEIDSMKGSSSAAIIPFSFDEILQCRQKSELEQLFLSRFKEYIYENNMFSDENPIEEEMLLFGDRGKVADEIVRRCEEKKHSGIFGLRRSGKSSVLRAVERRFDNNGIKYVRIDSATTLAPVSYNTALWKIALEIKAKAQGIEKNTTSNETDREFEQRIIESGKQNWYKEDYNDDAVKCFIQDVRFYTQNELFVIEIDEVERITYNSTHSEEWKKINSYISFWSALRDCGAALIVCGVNSTVNETNLLPNGGDNPMFERIHSVGSSSQTYIPAFTSEQTRQMLDTLGGFSNIGFSQIYKNINDTFGGQPFVIRQFCAFMFEQVKDLRNGIDTYQISMPTFEHCKEQFENSGRGARIFGTMLENIENFYPDEYSLLCKMAHNPSEYRIMLPNQAITIDHLEKYGLIEYDRTTNTVKFLIEALQRYLSQISEQDPLSMNQKQRKTYINENATKYEGAFKRFLLFKCMYDSGTNWRGILRSFTQKPIEDNMSFDYYFSRDHKLTLGDIKSLINKSWAQLSNDFSNFGISRDNLNTYLQYIIEARNKADHNGAIPAENSIPDSVIENFKHGITHLESFLKNFM